MKELHSVFAVFANISQKPNRIQTKKNTFFLCNRTNFSNRQTFYICDVYSFSEIIQLLTEEYILGLSCSDLSFVIKDLHKRISGKSISYKRDL